MTLSVLPLSYCTNVHPGKTVSEVQAGLERYTTRVAMNLTEPLAAGLWLARSVVDELLSPNAIAEFRDWLGTRELSCYTLNTFPFGDFHSDRVKENVYVPDWSRPERLQYTEDCASVLSGLLSEDAVGSMSTVPLGFKGFSHPADFPDRCIDQLLMLSRTLDRIHSETGRLITLAIEPEPLCVLETTAETITFFNRMRERAADQNCLEQAQRFLGVCYDVCHQSVEFEDVAESIEQLTVADIRINKVHITCAIEVDSPATNREAREALANYVEPRYLHQTFARTSAGKIHHVTDLDRSLALDPPESFRDAETWRVHFHVPVNVESLGPLRTTRPDLQRALTAVSQLDYAPHLEIETYTWEVLPDESPRDLADGLTAEVVGTRQLLTAAEKSKGTQLIA